MSSVERHAPLPLSEADPERLPTHDRRADVSARRTRGDVQGLRAVAVIAVILHHVLGWPAGGFVGVDVFFVISGFLITGLLLREAETRGSVSLARFYGRRVRRIAPAAVTVLVATVVASWFLFNQTRFWATVGDAVASFFFVVNWRFLEQGTDYFRAADAVSPLQHFWSLSVEEQFYLVWPWLLVVVVALTLRGGNTGAASPTPSAIRRVRASTALVLALITLGSFAFASWQTVTQPEAAYFSTLTRVWELGLGGLFAVAAPLFGRLPAVARGILGWIGLGGVIISFVIIDDAVPFPAPWAALPVAATALVLAAGVGGAQRSLFPLVNPIATFFGNISYSLYLWHFPILVFVLMLLPARSIEVNLVIFALILAVSIVSYYLIEQPLHRSPWLDTRDRAASGESRIEMRDRRRAEWQSWRDRFGAQFMVSSVGLFLIVIVVAVTTHLSLRGDGPFDLALPAGPAFDGHELSGDLAGDPDTNPEDQLQADLWAAAGATEWPSNLSPSMDSAIADGSSRNPAKQCFDIGATPDFAGCTWGDPDASRHIYLIGDSIALAYAPAFKLLAEKGGDDWRVTTIGLYGCRFTDDLVQNDGAGVMEACAQRKHDVADRIVSDAPQLVVVANAFALGETSGGRPLTAADMVASTAAETAKYGLPGQIVYLAPPPLGVNLGVCYSPVTSPQDCNAGVDVAWNDFETAVKATIASTGDHYVSSLPFSCADGYCPAFAGTIPTKYDTVHMTPEYAERVAPAIRWELDAQGLLVG